MENNDQREKEIALATLNPTGIEKQLANLEDAVLSGWVSPLDAIMAAKKFDLLLANLHKAIKDSAIVEMRSYPKGYTSQTGSIELKNSARRYSFKHISKWVELKDQLSDIENLSKAAYNTGRPIYDNDGEQIEPPIVSGGGETIAIKLSKS